LAAGWPGAGPFHPIKATGEQKSPQSQPGSADERKYRQTAFDLLEQASRGGLAQLYWAPQEQDLASLHELPEFKTLVSRSPKPRRPFGGG
jgi:hypothetical protein